MQDPPSDRFAIVPDAQALEQLDRVLRFFPVDNPAPASLSREEIEAFNSRGYLLPLDVFEPREADDQRRLFDSLLEEELRRGGDAYSISSAHLRHLPVRRLLLEPRIVRVVTDLLGPDVIGWGSHYFCKLPGDQKQVSWHQDATYWPLTPSKTVTVWLAIDDADEENACMQFLPGSHLEGLLDARPSDAAEQNVLNLTVADVERYGRPTPVVLRAGQASLHSDLLLHGSEANGSSRRRCGLTLRYCAADVRAHLGWEEKGVLAAGKAPPHWPRAEALRAEALPDEPPGRDERGSYRP